MKEIIDYLFSNQDLKYREFSANLSPNMSIDDYIGVRTPILKAYAKTLLKEKMEVVSDFLNELPHRYFEENQLHAFLISSIKDYDKAIIEVRKFLPYVDNWATCDQLRPRCFSKNKNKLLEEIEVWIKSEHTYTCRFAIGMLMAHFLDEDFDAKQLKMVSEVISEEYYINMMIAWYFATAMAKQYKATIPYIEKRKLPLWVHRKTISKCVDSFRIADDTKAYLKSLR